MKTLYVVLLIIFALLLLYSSVFGVDWLHSLVKTTIVGYGGVVLSNVMYFITMLVLITGAVVCSAVFYLRSWEGRKRHIGNVVLFKLKPKLRELKDEELKDAFKELNSFLLYLKKKGFSYALTFLSDKGKAVEILLIVKNPSTDVLQEEFAKMIVTDLKVSCRRWTIHNYGISNDIIDAIKSAFFCFSLKTMNAELILPHVYFTLPYDYSLGLDHDIVSYKRVEEVEQEIGIKLGKIDGTGEDFVLTVDDINKHILILGSTGLGKTTTSSIIISELAKHGIRVLIIDWHDEYFRLLRKIGIPREMIKVYNARKPYPLNPFDFKHGESVDEKVSFIVDIMESTLSLSAPQSYYLYEILQEELRDHVSGISFSTLLSKLKEYSDVTEGYSGREARYALMRKIRPLTIGQAKKLFEYTGSAKKELMGKPITIIELGKIRNNTLRRIYTLFLLKEIFSMYTQKGLSSKLKLVVVLDEFHNLASTSCDVLERLFSEIRKFGVGLIVVSQTLFDLPSYVLRNVNTKIIHSVKTYRDIKELVNILPYGPRYQDVIINLTVGEAVVYKVDMQHPVKVHIELPFRIQDF